MYGRSQQPYRWHVPHANDRAQRMGRFSYSRVSPTTRTETAQTSPFHSAKRRRLYGLNSRFDRMLQEVSWASNYTKVSRPRHKRTNSPSSSSMTNHDLPKTPTDSLNELGYVSGKIQKRFTSAMETGNQVVAGSSSPMLPEWLNNTLAALPPDHAVRCLKLPCERVESSIMNDHIDLPESSDAPDRDSVFAFQAPVDGNHSPNPRETNGQLESDLATFRIVRYNSMEFQENSPAASLTGNAPFSTPGPRWTAPQVPAPCSPMGLFSAQPMYRPTSPVTPKVKDSPQPFSTPGPFAPVRSTKSHFCTTTANRLDGHLCSVQCDGEQFSLFPNNDAPGHFSSSGFFHRTVSAGRTEHPSSYLTPELTTTVPKGKRVAVDSPRGLIWDSPTSQMRWSNGRDATTRTPALFLSDIQRDEKSFHGALPLAPTPIASSPDDDTESPPNLHLPHPTSNDILLPAFPVTPPLLSRRSPADFGWTPSDSQTSYVLGSFES